jgi:glycosyltransferase involved in cell wall biosynthesis
LRHLRDEYRAEVLLPGRGHFTEALAREGIPFWSFPSLTKWTLPGMVQLVRQEGFALVYANNTSSGSRNAFLAARLARVPFICHLQTMGWDQTWRRHWWLRLSDAVTTVSQACADSIRLAPPGRLYVAYNGLPEDELEAPPDEPSSASLRRELGIDREAAILLSLSHLCERKGQTHAVRALSGISRHASEAHLCLVGALDREPDYVETVEQLAAELGVRDRVHITGFRKDVKSLLHIADIFIHTALEDPQPRAVLEAMGAELPVVAFSADGVNEMVVHGETGFLVEIGDSLGLAEGVVKLLTQDARRREFGRAGRERVMQTFTARKNAAQMSRVIREVLSRE